jgi:hypothetical protein
MTSDDIPTGDTPTGDTPTGHPDFEALNAYFDGEAPELAAHVSGCPDCRVTVKWIRTASTMVRAPVPPLADADRERSVARALEAFGSGGSVRDAMDERHPAATPSPPQRVPRPVPVPGVPAPVPAGVRSIDSGRRRRSRAGGGSGSGMWVGLGSAAAVVVALIIAVGVVGGGGGGDDATVASGGAATQERTTSAGASDETFAQAPEPAVDPASPTAGGGVPGPGADVSKAIIADGAGGVDGGDLGDIPDAATLAERARPVLGQRNASVAAAPGVSSLAATPPAAAEPTPRIVGTRPCEMEARTARPELGTVVYFAVGRVSQTPVIVLGFEPTSGPVILLALAQQEGCRVVLEAAGP